MVPVFLEYILTNNLSDKALTNEKLIKKNTINQKMVYVLRQIISFVLIFVVVYMGMNFLRQPNAQNLPQVSLNDINGIPQTLTTGTHLLYFWGSWCHICRHTSPSIDKLAKDYAVTSVAVSSGTDDELKAYMQKHNYQFSVVNDDDSKIFGAIDGQVTPSYVIVKDGKVVQSFVGLQPLWVLKARMAWAKF